MTDSPTPPPLKTYIHAAGGIIRKAIINADGPLPPDFLVKFLLTHWCRYLVRVHHRRGTRSPEWQEAVQTTDRLLLSVLPVTNQAERTQLAKTLPKLISDLRRGAALGRIDELEMAQFMTELGELHLRKLSPSMPFEKAYQTDFSDTVAVDMMDPGYRALMDKLDGFNDVEHIEL